MSVPAVRCTAVLCTSFSSLHTAGLSPWLLLFRQPQCCQRQQGCAAGSLSASVQLQCGVCKPPELRPLHRRHAYNWARNSSSSQCRLQSVSCNQPGDSSCRLFQTAAWPLGADLPLRICCAAAERRPVFHMAPAGGWINGEWDSVAEAASAWYNRPRLHQPTTDTVLSVPPHLCWTHLETDPNGMCGSTQLLNNWPAVCCLMLWQMLLVGMTCACMPCATRC